MASANEQPQADGDGTADEAAAPASPTRARQRGRAGQEGQTGQEGQAAPATSPGPAPSPGPVAPASPSAPPASAPAPRPADGKREFRAADGQREFRAAELAEAAGITTRTLRFYRERKLLPPPRREGRIAWYDEHHLARLRSITALLARGHTLGGIADLMDAFEKGRDARTAAEVMGLDGALATPFSDETPVRLTPEELADYFQGEVTVDNLAASLDIGYVAIDGDEFVHTSRRLLEGSAELVAKGIPLAAVLEMRPRTALHNGRDRRPLRPPVPHPPPPPPEHHRPHRTQRPPRSRGPHRQTGRGSGTGPGPGPPRAGGTGGVAERALRERG